MGGPPGTASYYFHWSLGLDRSVTLNTYIADKIYKFRVASTAANTHCFLKKC